MELRENEFGLWQLRLTDKNEEAKNLKAPAKNKLTQAGGESRRVTASKKIRTNGLTSVTR
jgi:hypothetical protein